MLTRILTCVLVLLGVAHAADLSGSQLVFSSDGRSGRSPVGRGDGARTGEAIQPDDFIRVSSSKTYLVNKHDEPVYLNGINYWACMNLAADEDYGGDRSRFLLELDQLAGVGVNHLRIMAASEGAPTPQPSRMLPALMPAPYQWDERVFVGLDRCVAEASKRGMRVTMTLANTWAWSGGMPQYVSWLEENNGTIPYPSQWNLTAEPQRDDGYAGWGSCTKDAASYGDFMRYANRFFNSSASQRLYRAHVDRVLHRRNTVSGIVYKDDPAILAWEAANEPQVAVDTPGSSAFNLTYVADDPVYAWLNATAAYVKQRAPRQLFTTGAEAKQGRAVFRAMHASAHVDYACAHLWVENWQRYNSTDRTAANLHAAVDWARAYLADVARWSEELDKPVLLEEFGMARDNWENLDNGRYRYHEAAPTRNRDAYFASIFDLVSRNFLQGRRFIGTTPWAYGGIYRPSNQTLSSHGILFAGDPPHEGPGWYDVYSDDRVMQLMHEQQRNVSFFLNVGRSEECE